LIERLRLGETDERSEAAKALGRLPMDALAGLKGCLTTHTPAHVTVAALEAVRLARATRFESEAMALLHVSSPSVRLAALRAVGALPGTRADVALVRALGDRDEVIQSEALELMVERGGSQAVPTLVALLSAADSLRFRVIRALGRLGATEAAPKLECLYGEAPLHERVEILASLAAIAPRRSVGLLAQALESPERELRRTAATALADVAGHAELDLLLAMARDDDPAIRNEAARALGRLNTPAGRDTLLLLARDVESAVAQTARSALLTGADGSGAAAA
jgi:HEAT repeat protein